MFRTILTTRERRRLGLIVGMPQNGGELFWGRKWRAASTSSRAVRENHLAGNRVACNKDS